MEVIDIFSREQAIELIAETFPPDALEPLRRHIGSQLLEQARAEAVNWRYEPDSVLFRLAELCQAEVARRVRNADRNREAGL